MHVYVVVVFFSFFFCGGGGVFVFLFVCFLLFFLKSLFLITVDAKVILFIRYV